jgi:uncharacterized damage-inducible protein DinB
MLDALKTYDYLARARRQLFDWVRPLSPGQYATEFPIGPGTLGRTLTHIMICEWFYMQRIQALPVPPYSEWVFQDETPPPFRTLEAEWLKQQHRTRAGLAAVRDWTADLEYAATDDHENPIIITATRADIFTQLVLHEVHHRAQAMNMLRQLGVKLSDIDYNELMYRRRPA